jgi:hypothetical protein
MPNTCLPPQAAPLKVIRRQGGRKPPFHLAGLGAETEPVSSLTCPDQAMEFQDRSLGFHTLRQIGMDVLGKKLGGVRL